MQTQSRSKTRRHAWRLSVLGAVAAALLLAVPVSPAHSAAAPLAPTTGTYTNPIIPQTTPDPAVIKALDGYYYLIPTADYWQNGAGYHLLPIWRSSDLVNWTFVGNAFPARPAWIDPNAGVFAPDLQYYNHKYYMYYVAANTNPLPAYGTTGGSAIGVATADTPAGPWTDAGPAAGGSYQTGPIVPPRPCLGTNCGGPYFATIDPAEFTDQDGQKYLYYGSYFGGTLVQKLAPDGLHTEGAAIQIGHWDRYEGTYVVRHDYNGQRYYYNFSSAADCCRGPNTAYSVEVNRATSPLGPFVDQNGFPMLQPGPAPASTDSAQDPAGKNVGAQGGGYPTLKQNGNRWQGVGHNALITDLSGQDWIVYHGVDKNNGWVNGYDASVGAITYRQALLDRLDWTADGWPIVNSGNGPSDGPTAAPLTTPTFGDNFNPPSSCAAPGSGAAINPGWQALGGTWSANSGTCTTGGFAQQTAAVGQALLVHPTSIAPGYRAECDVSLVAGAGRYGCVVSYRQLSPAGGLYLAVYLDATQNALVTIPYNNGRPIGAAQATSLPATFDHNDWHHLAIDQAAGHGQPVYTVTVSDRNRDPLAVQRRTLPAAFAQYGGGIGFVTQNAQAQFDNVTIAPLATGTVPTPQAPALGALLKPYSDDFGGTLGPQWSWIREDPALHGFAATGALSITVNGDLYRDANSATNLLVETPPASNYAVETKLTFDPNNNFQQAGLLIYSDDDHYIKVGPFHHFSLSKILSGYESLTPVPSYQTTCDVQPSPSSIVAVMTYTAAQCPNEGEGWDYLTNPQLTANGSTAYNPSVTDWLRIYRNGDTYTPYVSLDHVHWVRGQAWTLTAASPSFPIRIGLFAFSGGPNNDVPALFDYVHVYQEP